jgi:hypothetical protein
LRSDGDANKHFYRKGLSDKEIVREGKVRTLESGKPLIELLQKTSPRHAS